jgi:YhcH/YjgK/YiaL family protein
MIFISERKGIMFFSHISIAEKYNYLDEKFTCAYRWLAETDLKSLPEATYKLIGEDDVYAMVQEYSTSPWEERKFETHDRYFDIQYMVTGNEIFGVCKRDGLREIERIDSNDVVFYEDPDLFGEVLLKEGDLIVVAPEDAHKPRCAAGSPAPVKKVVIKVKI